MKTTRRRGFTLIELLAVIGIITVLAALLLPAAVAVYDRIERTRAANEARLIKAAIQAYFQDYGKLPSAAQGADAFAEGPESASIVRILMGLNPALNPKNFAYLESRGDAEAALNFPDPWDRQYGIKMDLDYDGRIAFKGKVHVTPVLVVSGGPDERIDETQAASGAGADDIFSSQ